jgi:hypothetical protein
MSQNDWSFQEDESFNVALTQRTEELYRVPNQTPDEEGCIEALVLPLRDIVIFPHMSPRFLWCARIPCWPSRKPTSGN